MTDLHTHILPEMDDGSGSVLESLSLLQMEREQGVDTVILTPHLYREREPVARFLERRQAAFDRLRAELTQVTQKDGPKLLLGAEVAWFPSLMGEEQLDRLCLGGTRYLLLELHFEPWPPHLLKQVYEFSCSTGLTPVLAHVERYLSIQDRGKIQDLISMGFPMQMNADSLLRFWSRKRCLDLLRSGTWYLGSDCHSLDRRPPRMGQAVPILQKKLGVERTAQMLHWRTMRESEASAV